MTWGKSRELCDVPSWLAGNFSLAFRSQVKGITRVTSPPSLHSPPQKDRLTVLASSPFLKLFCVNLLFFHPLIVFFLLDNVKTKYTVNSHHRGQHQVFFLGSVWLTARLEIQGLRSGLVVYCLFQAFRSWNRLSILQSFLQSLL